MRTAIPIAILSLPLLASCASLNKAAHVATGLTSHQLCSAAFVSGIDPDEMYRQQIKPALGPASALVRYRVDRARLEATASLAGLARTHAVYRGVLGCLVLHGAKPSTLDISERDEPVKPRLEAIAGPGLVEPTDARLRAALDAAFRERATGPRRWAKAVVILHEGHVVAERYAPGYGINTPITGWSMTKSITNALAGILVRQGRLAMDRPAEVTAWSHSDDPRHAITPDQLLRMTSGLELGNSVAPTPFSGFAVDARAVFAERDKAGFSAASRLRAAPGKTFTYSDASTLILSGLIRDKVGGDTASVYRFAHRELFDVLGMSHAVLEFDALGTPLGATHLWATARDWARFGQLYLDDGIVGGERLLPAGWVEYSARQTPGSELYGYGAGFWTNRGSGPAVSYRRSHGMPADSFYAHGNFGQSLIIVPSARLVIVWLGSAHTPRGDIEAAAQLTSDAIAATSTSGKPPYVE